MYTHTEREGVSCSNHWRVSTLHKFADQKTRVELQPAFTQPHFKMLTSTEIHDSRRRWLTAGSNETLWSIFQGSLLLELLR